MRIGTACTVRVAFGDMRTVAEVLRNGERFYPTYWTSKPGAAVVIGQMNSKKKDAEMHSNINDQRIEVIAEGTLETFDSAAYKTELAAHLEIAESLITANVLEPLVEIALIGEDSGLVHRAAVALQRLLEAAPEPELLPEPSAGATACMAITIRLGLGLGLGLGPGLGSG